MSSFKSQRSILPIWSISRSLRRYSDCPCRSVRNSQHHSWPEARNAHDHNLPLLIGYGLIPIAKEDPTSITTLAASCQLPLTRKLIARRLGEDIESNPAPINALLTQALKKPIEFQNDIVAGLSEALRGWSKAKKPAAWEALQTQLSKSNDPKLQSRVRDLSVLFGDGRALDEVKRVALDNNVELSQRQAALETLIANKPPDLRQICEQLLSVRFLNTVAIRGLAQFDDPAIGEKLTASYSRFHALERDAVLDTLTSRPTFARSLLKQLAAGEIPRRDVTPFYGAASAVSTTRSSRPNSPKSGANCATAHPTNESRLRAGKKNLHLQSSLSATKATVAPCLTRPARLATCCTATATTQVST